MVNEKDRKAQAEFRWKIQRMQASDVIRAIQEEVEASMACADTIASEEPKEQILQSVRYSGEGDSTRRFAEEMVASGMVEQVRQRKGNLAYEYFFQMEGSDLLLRSVWQSWAAMREYCKSPLIQQIVGLLKKYKLEMTVERFRAI